MRAPDGGRIDQRVGSLLAHRARGFKTALVIGGVIGVNVFGPGGTPASFTAFLAAVLGILGAVVATALTLQGARAALKGIRKE